MGKNGMTTMKVFDIDVYHPGAGVLLTFRGEEPVIGVVTYASHVELKVARYNENTGRILTSSVDIDDICEDKYSIKPVFTNGVVICEN